VAGLLLAYHLRVFQRDAALAREDEAARPPVPAIPAAPVSSADGAAQAADTVTVLIVRPPPTVDADTLREHIRAGLPPGATIDAVKLESAEATRLLDGR